MWGRSRGPACSNRWACSTSPSRSRSAPALPAPSSCTGSVGQPARGSVGEYGLDDAVRAAVEAVVGAGGVVQRLVVGDDLAGPGTPADDQVTQVGGVPAVVGAAEP